jgi:Fe-S oxidoreductase
VELLERWGFKVTLSPCFASLRLSISLGLLDQARAHLIVALDWLRKHIHENNYIIGLEPSELLTYRDEAAALAVKSTDIDTLEKLKSKMVLFDEFVSDHKTALAGKTSFRKQITNIAVHVHCHQKSLSSPEKCIDALQLIPQSNIQPIPSGCCGMAGFFGYEKQNYELSAQIAELVLLPFIRNLPADTKIVATGASCRQQIYDFLKIKAYHPAQLLYQQLDG